MNENTKTLFATLVGSRLYGLEGIGSDYDYRGVKITPLVELLLSKSTKNEQMKLEGQDKTYYEGNHFIRLLMGGNPTMLEMIYSLRLYQPDFLRRYPLEELLDSQAVLRSTQGFIKGQLAKPTYKGLATAMLYVRLYHCMFDPQQTMDAAIGIAKLNREGKGLNHTTRYVDDFLLHEDEYCREADMDVAGDILKLWYI